MNGNKQDTTINTTHSAADASKRAAGHAPTYLVCGCKSWNREVFDDMLAQQPGRWIYIDKKDQLNAEALASYQPTYIFFLHWSWLVPEAIHTQYPCVCFHMTDVPFGRGGSPLQNLIVRGHKHTTLTALQMVAQVDAGPVYFKQPMSLAGSAQDILVRSSELAAKMILEIVATKPEPTPQQGEVVEFQRRKPHESQLPEGLSPAQTYDFIRMLDGEGYPPAYIEYGELRFEFNAARLLDNNQLAANVRITPIHQKDESK